MVIVVSWGGAAGGRAGGHEIAFRVSLSCQMLRMLAYRWGLFGGKGDC